MVVHGTPHPLDWYELYRLAITETFMCSECFTRADVRGLVRRQVRRGGL